MLKAISLGAVCALIFTGCQSNPNMGKKIGASQMSESTIEILAQESQKAVIAQQSLQTAQAEHLKTLKVKQARFNVDVINANYIGSPEILLNSVANHYGYRYLENGAAHTLPIVNFTNRKETGFELVKDIGVFVDGHANITIDHLNKTIVLTYLAN